MSVASAIENLKSRINDAYAALLNKGATIPEQKTTANLPNTINSIPEPNMQDKGTVVLNRNNDTTTATTLFEKDIYPDEGYDGISHVKFRARGLNLTVNPTKSQQVKEAPTANGTIGYKTVTINPVTSSIDSNIQAQNIKSGVSILGVTGTLTPGITPTGTIDIHINDQDPYPKTVDVSNYSYADVYWEYVGCILKDTLINLDNRSTKKIQDITYNDEILCWNFDECKMDKSKPFWIKKGQKTDHYWINKFESGKEIRTTGTIAGHRFFNIDKNKFLYNTECVGNYCYTLNGKDKLIEAKYIEEECIFYNIYTHYHMNLFANSILTGFRYNNLYPIQNMKFIKDNRKLRDRMEFQNIPDSWYYGMRCSEQTDSVQNIEDYVNEREIIKKDF